MRGKFSLLVHGGLGVGAESGDRTVFRVPPSRAGRAWHEGWLTMWHLGLGEVPGPAGLDNLMLRAGPRAGRAGLGAFRAWRGRPRPAIYFHLRRVLFMRVGDRCRGRRHICIAAVACNLSIADYGGAGAAAVRAPKPKREVHKLREVREAMRTLCIASHDLRAHSLLRLVL